MQEDAQACECAVCDFGIFIHRVLCNFYMINMASEGSHIQRTEKKINTKRDGTPNQHVMDTFWDTEWGCGSYPPGGGETSKVISGRGGAPLLSGTIFSEHVTNIMEDRTAAFYKHRASASALLLSVSHSNVHTNTDGHTSTHTHLLVHTVEIHTLAQWCLILDLIWYKKDPTEIAISFNKSFYSNLYKSGLH